MKPIQTQGNDPEVDETVWSAALSRLGGLFTSIANEFIQAIQVIAQPSNSTSSYEKCGQIIQVIQKDGSDYTNGITRDLVGQNRTGAISGGNQTGRVWGGYDEAGCDAGSDGFVLARETGGNNNGSEQPLIGTQTSKFLEACVAGEYLGNKKMTGVRYIEGGNSQFFNGDIFERSAFVGDAAPVVGVRDGNQIISSLRADGTIQLRFFIGSTRPTLQPGTAAIWGDTATGTTYFLFFDGGTYLASQLSAI